jgi:vanillate O-demethylase monooxygenase subunit
LTPETETSTHYFFAHPHNFAIDRPEVTESVHQSVVVAFEEDRTMIRAQARSLELKPDFDMIPIKADNALGRFRFLVDKMIRDEAQANAGSPSAAKTSAPVGAEQ